MFVINDVLSISTSTLAFVSAICSLSKTDLKTPLLRSTLPHFADDRDGRGLRAIS